MVLGSWFLVLGILVIVACCLLGINQFKAFLVSALPTPDTATTLPSVRLCGLAAVRLFGRGGKSSASRLFEFSSLTADIFGVFDHEVTYVRWK